MKIFNRINYKTKRKVLIAIFIGIMLIVISWILWLFFMPRTVDLAEYTLISYEGTSGEGSIELSIDDSLFLDDMNISIEADKTDHLSNGDIIHITFNYDEAKCRSYGVKIKRDTWDLRLSCFNEPIDE